MIDAERIRTLQARYPHAIRDWTIGPRETALGIAADQLVPVCEYLRDESNPRYDLLVTLTPTGDQLLYQLTSLGAQHRLRLCVPQPAKEPAIESIAFVWPAANWAEREAHDLWQITFVGHPNLKSLLRHPHLEPLLPDPVQREGFTLSRSRFPVALGGLRLDLDTDDGRITGLTPRIGYQHAHFEERLANTAFTLGPTIAARLDAFSPMCCDLAYALAVERLLGVTPPPRAQMLRVIYAELQRLASHLFWLARFAQQLSEPPFAAPTYAWQGREAIVELFQWLGGNPFTPDAISVGGLAYDAPQGWTERVYSALACLKPLIDDLDFLFDASSVGHQLDGVGVIDPGTALGLGVTGPNLRSCGIAYDIRTAFPYAAYSSLDVQVPVQEVGDAHTRYRQRVAETRASARLIDQALSLVQEGPVNALAQEPIVVPAGTSYAAVEAPRGELGVLIVSTGQRRPKRVHVRAPSFANLSCLPFVVRGASRDQVDLILESLDLSISEAER